MKGSRLWQEFKEFAFKGNMIDLAVAVVIGTAFGAAITSLVKNILMPAVGWVFALLFHTEPGKEGYREWAVGPIKVGEFLGDFVNFLIVATAVFVFVVKLIGTIKKYTSAPAPSEPTTKECPLCLSIIPLKARRCAHCTADL